MTARALAIEGLVVHLGSVTAVDGAHLEAREREITALVGPSGCGKTTLLRTVAGFERPSAGQISIAGEVVASPHVWVPAERRRLGMVFQTGALFPHLTVRGNVGYGLTDRARADSRTDAVLELVGMGGLGGRFPDELSGGQQQRVALARALAPEPRLVLMDEPFAALDASLRVELREEVRAILARAGATTILVTHDQEEALSVADTVAVMAEGRILQSGSPTEVYGYPDSVEVSRILGGGATLECTVTAGRLTSALGSVETDEQDCAGRIVVRPEDLELTDGQGGVAAEVIAERFFGHDLLQIVRLETGEEIGVRVLARQRRDIGSQVGLKLVGRVGRVYR